MNVLKNKKGQTAALLTMLLTSIGIGTVVGIGYGIYKGVKKFINKKPAVKTKSLEKVKNLV